ncbi:carboxymuconolactone decarboxylase family protein, partial [Burkholderia multivorans]
MRRLPRSPFHRPLIVMTDRLPPFDAATASDAQK